MKKIIILLFILTNILFASIGQITALVGEIKISRDSKETLAKLGEKLEKKDVINSSKGAKAQITLDDNTIITIGQNSTLNIFDYAFDETKPKDSKASFGFMKGSFKSITGKIGKINKDRFKLKTKSASIGIRGTTIVGNQRMIACTDGAIAVSSNGVTVFVEKQEVTRTPEGQAPTPAEPLTPETLNTLEKESTGGNGNDNGGENGNDDGDTGGNDDEGDGTTTQDDGTSNTNNDDTTTGTENIDTGVADDVSSLADDTTESTTNDDVSSSIDNTISSSNTSSINSYTYKGYASAGNYTNGTLSSVTTGKVGMEINGEREITSYLITDFTDNSTYKDGTTYSTSYYYDEDDSELVMKWGNWNSTTYNTTENSSGYTGSWVTGIETATNIVNSYLNGSTTQTLAFAGNVIGGSLIYNSTDYTFQSGTVNFSFSLGNSANTFTGSVSMVFDNATTLNIDLTNGTASNTGFTSSDLDVKLGSGNVNPNWSGKVDGSFYGTGSIKAIGGSIKIEGDSIDATGVFEGTLQSTQIGGGA